MKHRKNSKKRNLALFPKGSYRFLLCWAINCFTAVCTVRKFTLQILRGFSASYKDARLPLSLQICVCVCTLRNLRLLLLLSLLVWMVGTITKAANLFPQEIRRKKSACLLNSTFSLFTMLKS